LCIVIAFQNTALKERYDGWEDEEEDIQWMILWKQENTG